MARSSSGGRINISATTKKIDVDNRISLLFYYRIADNILKQADIFREEKNVVDLYVMLLRFSSLVTETIPCHRDYRSSPQGNKLYLKRKLITALTELEELKPAVQAKLQELHSKQIYQLNKQQNSWKNDTLESSVEWPAIKQNLNDYSTKKRVEPVTSKFGYQGLKPLSLTKPVEEHLRRISLSIFRPKEETLSKHSILGRNGLHGQWQPPSNCKVQYPSNVDFTPLQIPRFNNIQHSSQNEIIRQPSPPPLLADVQDLIPTSTPATQAECGLEDASNDALVCSEDPLQLHILAKSNTDKNLETCGVLAGSLRNRKFYITALIIPKQESTSDSCQTTNEEEIFEVQDKQCLFPLGWIHFFRAFSFSDVERVVDSLKEVKSG
ncbi:hypothetical protein Pfo_028123 [Paulownia fortunei]|nr:hypothetical protein Pfo_028123 [Paulownia fortunei]